MNLREDDVVSAVALVMEDEADTSAVVQGDAEELKPIDEIPGDVPVDLDPGVADDRARAGRRRGRRGLAAEK